RALFLTLNWPISGGTALPQLCTPTGSSIDGNRPPHSPWYTRASGKSRRRFCSLAQDTNTTTTRSTPNGHSEIFTLDADLHPPPGHGKIPRSTS
ncbi:hypothetical protein BKA70DRAFT_1294374, partial [Coprinopsis sp. MPI-PUGE-AT-0042]